MARRAKTYTRKVHGHVIRCKMPVRRYGDSKRIQKLRAKNRRLYTIG